MSDPQASPARAAVGFVTVSYGSEDELAALIASARAATARELRVVVVDNHPDGTAETLAGELGVDYLALPENPGYGTAVNRGIASLEPGIAEIVISNPDVRWHPRSIDVLLAALEDSTIAAAGPAILNEDGSVYPSARAIPSLRTGVGHALFANLWLANPWTREYRRSADTTRVGRDAGWLSGAGLIVRRSAFETVDGFDEGYFMYFEDVDLGYRLGRGGYRNRYVPDAEVVHGGGHSTAAESEAMIAAHHTSASRFLHRKYAGPWLAPVRWVLDLGLLLRSALVRRGIRRSAEQQESTR